MDAETATRSKPISFWVYSGGSVLFGLLTVSMLSTLFLSGEAESDRAVKSSQRIVVAFASGAVESKPAVKPAVTETKPPLPPVEVPAEKPVSQPPSPSTPVNGSTEVPVVEKSVPPAPLPEPPEAPEPQNTKIVLPEIPNLIRGTGSLAVAPNKALVEKVEEYTIPKIAQDGNAAWKYYAKPVAVEGKKPLVALIITGLGHNRQTVNTIFTLPNRFTLSFSPYAKDTPLWVINARNLGYEVMADLPLEPSDFPASDPGPYAIVAEKAPGENLKRLYWSLSRFSGFIGMLAPTDEALTSTPASLIPLVQELTNRGVAFVYRSDKQNALFTEMAKQSKLFTLGAELIVDEQLSDAAIDAQLNLLIERAKKNRVAVGIARPYPITIEALRRWINVLKTSGVELVPVSAILYNMPEHVE